MKFGRRTALLLAGLGALHLAVLMAGLFSPYDVAQQNRDLPFAPPTRIHFVDAESGIHVRPFVCDFMDRPDSPGEYSENCDKHFPVHFLVNGVRYRMFGLVESDVHLFGVRAPAHIFLMGTDGYGRDVFSRFLYGGQISLFVGILATALSLGLGTLVGSFAGYYGGWFDSVAMRVAELFLALPWLYLLFALRAFIPLSLSANEAFLLLIAVIGAVGWARPARLIRSVVLSSREHQYVRAAQLFGGSDAYILRRHILPDVHGVVLTQAVLLIPQYVLAEVTLSFLGLGVAEPTPSWGNMLSSLQQYYVLASYWWMLVPGLVLIPVFLGYMLLAGETRSNPNAAHT